MQNAAIFLHPNGFDTTTGRLLGRHSAGESFLRGFLRHADVDRFDFWDAAGQGSAKLEPLVRRIAEPSKPIRWIGATQRGQLTDPGVLNTPGPQINREAWLRRPFGSRAYAVTGLTHTTATELVMATIGDLLVAPTEPFDALICTSSAVRASVESQLDGVRAHLAEDYGPRRRGEPMRATIPLGVNVDDFAVNPEDRKTWRERLSIPEDAVVALYVGRFNVKEKMNPALMAIALERSAVATGKPIYWVNSGWAESAEEGRIYHEQTRALCPTVTYIEIDGREPGTRFSIWSVADFFISFSENIQESFGLTPIEAMAAGLPCVVTDWNGYKDTVQDGEHGFRISTLSPHNGAGGDLAYWFANQWTSYQDYVAGAAQYVAIDYAEAVAAISSLVLNPELRRKLGAQARERARSTFDWSAIIPQYQALWAEQNARRLSAAAEAPREANPYRPDPYGLFASYPTRTLTLEDHVELTPGSTWPDAWTLLSRPIASYSRLNRPDEAEVELICKWLADNGGGRVVDLLQAFPMARRPYIRRGLLWIARYGVIQIRPKSS